MKRYSSLTIVCFCLAALAQAYSDDLVSGGIYYITGASTGKVLDIYGGSTADGANLIQYTNHQGLNQQFKIENAPGADGVIITAMHSGLVLDVYGGSTQPGTQIIQWPYHGGANQRWMVIGRGSCVATEDGPTTCGTDGYTFSSMNSGLGMAVATATSADATNIVQGGTGESFFVLTRVSS